MNTPAKKLTPINIGGYTAYINHALGYYPYFMVELRNRLENKLACNIITTGEAGIGKTYQDITFARILNKRMKAEEDVVFEYPGYMKSIMQKGKRYVPIVFDEPQYDTGKHEWHKQRTRALINTITSQRFRLRPLFIPIINLSLLDKTLRSYLVQYHVIVDRRGEGRVYRLTPSQFEDKLYRNLVCRFEYEMLDLDLCSRESCLDCKKLHRKEEPCQIFRAIYERRKAEIQNRRDTKGAEEAEEQEKKTLNNTELAQILLDKVSAEQLKNSRNAIDATKISFELEKLGIRCGVTKSRLVQQAIYDLKPSLRPALIG